MCLAFSLIDTSESGISLFVYLRSDMFRVNKYISMQQYSDTDIANILISNTLPPNRYLVILVSKIFLDLWTFVNFENKLLWSHNDLWYGVGIGLSCKLPSRQ